MRASAGSRAIAIVGVGAVLPDAPNVPTFWANLKAGRYSISDVPPERWDPSLYYDPDPRVPDRTYTRIGGWVRQYEWNPLAWKLPIPPRVSAVMDATQKLAIVATREALEDYGYPERRLDTERTGVIFGNAMGGDTHLLSAARILFPEIAEELKSAQSFRQLPPEVRSAVLEELQTGVRTRIPDITEDTMPGELSNITAGRIAALYDLRGPNFVTDAACASTMAALVAAVEALESGACDVVISGGIDANMSPSSFVKFCKIGALSATGSRPYAEGADGFVMGEGGVVLVLKRLADAEAAGDRIYAVIRGIGGSSDGKGKGITAPNPAGQKLAITRAWEDAGAVLQAGDLIEGHGTSTRVGDVVEVNSLIEVIGRSALPAGSVALGSVKSNLGHLKAAAGGAGVLKVLLALYEKLLPPSINFHAPNPEIDFEHSPLRVNTELRAWVKNGAGDGVRRAGVSAFGFGGTNFHVVLEEYVPGRLRFDDAGARATSAAVPAGAASVSVRGSAPVASTSAADAVKAPLRGALVIGGANEAEIRTRLAAVAAAAERGVAPAPCAPRRSDLAAPVRLAIDYGDAAELADLAGKALAALDSGEEGRWRALRNKGVYLGRGTPGKVAFLYTGQGSQYVNMLRELRAAEPIVQATFAEADGVMTPLLGCPLTEKIFVQAADEEALAAAEHALKQTVVTQPAVLTVDTALSRLFQSWGIAPDMVMGHSLGEYGALVAAGALPLGDALRAVSARGEAMTHLNLGDNGIMAAAFGSPERVSEVLQTVDGYAVVANINSTKECVIGGASEAMVRAMEALRAAGIRVQQLAVSHAFHTEIVAPASGPLMQVLSELQLSKPRLPVIANVTGEFYPTEEPFVPRMIEILGQQVGSPVQFVKGLETLYAAGARVFVEMGPKRVLHGLVEDVLGEREGVVSLYTNHPRTGDMVSVNRALCGLYALGLGNGTAEPVTAPAVSVTPVASAAPVAPAAPVTPVAPAAIAPKPAVAAAPPAAPGEPDLLALGRLLANVLEQGMSLYAGGGRAAAPRVGITGAALGLPGRERVFDDEHVARILNGEQFISQVPEALRREMANRGITRLMKGANGEASFEVIDDVADVIKLAGRAGALDLAAEFGYPEERLDALDRVTMIAIAAGIDALRDAGIPLVQRYRTTTTGGKLPIGWSLPESLRDDTGIIFTSAFPGYDNFARIITEYHEHRARCGRLEELRAVRASVAAQGGAALAEVDRRIAALEQEIGKKPFRFDRRFLFQVLNMGHSQFAEYIGARGPNVGTNAACASGTQAVAMARDWIEAGRCRRVIVISADDITTDTMLPWFASGFLASGAAATDERVEDAALPFDRRRHGLIIGMGGAALVVESFEAAAERAVQPICEVMGSVIANSAFHGSRLDVEHIQGVMERLVSDVERRYGIDRASIAREAVFVSHETYTPARGGSASAEVFALRKVFGEHVNDIVVANTKGFTGHPMAVAMEDAISVKILETGIVPPVANYREVDPELGVLNLSRGGSYPARFVLRLGAGFGSQISMTMLQWLPPASGVRPGPRQLGFQYRITDRRKFQQWLEQVSGESSPELEVVQRTLRVKANGAVRTHAASTRGAASGNGTGNGAGSRVIAAPAPVSAATSSSAAPTAPVPAPQAAAVTQQAAPGDAVRQRVLAIVAEQTGYPTDMLDPDLDLEADLGIDTVKQAEMFAAIRAEYGIERDENLALRDYPTLGRAIEFVFEKRPDLKTAAAPAAPAVTPVAAPAPAATAAAPDAPAAAAAGDAVRERVIAIVAEQTGYPADMLDPDLDLEADLGIDTVKQAEMFAAIRAEFGIERDENLALRDYPTLARAVEFVYEKRPDLKAAAAAAAPAVVAPAAAAPAPAVFAAPTPVAAATAAAGDAVRERVIAIVAEQTGYPADMLDPELDLEADLGIDTVKQAEMFAAIRAEFGIERDENLALRDYPTLARAVEFVYEKRPDLRAAAAPATPAGAIPAPATAAPATVAPATPAPAAAGTDRVRDAVIAIVAEQTGYPADMLDLELDLEADLGIDTVKQAEMFAAIRAEFGIERDENLALRDYPTLARAIEFVYEKRPELRSGAGQAANVAVADAAAQATSPEDAAGAAKAPVVADMAAAQAMPRRVPVPRVRPPLGCFASTGIELNQGDRVIVLGDAHGVANALISRLEKRGVVVLRLVGQTGDELSVQVEQWRAEGSIRGVYWLAGLDAAPMEALLEPAARAALVQQRVKGLYRTVRALYETFAEAGVFLVSATRLGGRHGYDGQGTDPLGGAISGLTKSVARERPNALVKVVDFAPGRQTAALADRLIEETLTDAGVVEVGYTAGQRWQIALEEQPLETVGELPTGGTWVVTGAAGSITSAIVADLAAASQGEFWLLDLVPEPDPADPDLARLESDVAGLKRDLFARIQARGERATPALVEKELARLERARAALATMEAVRAAGGVAHWRSVDLRDAAAVKAAIDDVRAKAERVDVLVHAAGIEISRALPDKKPTEYDLVFDVKVEGWFNLLAALGELPLGTALVFSSIAGRFGNAGQADYSAANDLLCKAMCALPATHGARGIAIDWTAWAEIGMASRGSIPTIMKAAGIDMLPPAAGIPVVRRELASGTSGEVLIAGALGAMLQERAPAGGWNTDRCASGLVCAARRCDVNDGLVVELELDPAAQPFLHDHAINGVPVLPGVMGVELMCEAAQLPWPELRVAAAEDVAFSAPFKFYRNEPRTITIEVRYSLDGDDVVADCALLGVRALHGRSEPERTRHFTARVRLTGADVTAAEAVTVPAVTEAVTADAIYGLYFHGPAYRVLERAWRDGPVLAGELSAALPPNQSPADAVLLTGPRLLELAFQTAGLIGVADAGHMGLPHRIGSVTVHAAPPAEAGGVVALAQPRNGGYDIVVCTADGQPLLTVSDYQTAMLSGTVETEPFSALVAAVEAG